MAKGRNARSFDAVADLSENHRDQPQDVLSAVGPIVSAAGAPVPSPIGVTVGMPSWAHVQPIALTAGMETI